MLSKNYSILNKYRNEKKEIYLKRVLNNMMKNIYIAAKRFFYLWNINLKN